ncbi:MAG: carboxypeptidase-like regulatory domain-containing protein [Salinivirgaceae bacterium]|nr:carboxypeptidase-like regulatory domain-containing protein [Salinivirgaceae bacterium]
MIDAETDEPMPFVNVAVPGTQLGTITDVDGKFFIETRIHADTLVVSYMGYHSFKVAVRNGAYQELALRLEPDNIVMDEIVVHPGENPAFRILREINENKPRNNPMRQSLYTYEVYNKMELDVNNITDEYRNQKIFKKFQFVFDYVDTSAITGKTFLPIFITETLSDYYYQKNPKREKEVIKASRISGTEDDMVSEFTGKMYLDFNLYDNFVPILGHDFVSPIANIGRVYYKYYLIDSAFRDNRWCYQISFKPKRKQEPTFTGYFWVHDTTYAIESYKIRISEGVNINFVSDFVAEQSFTYVEDSVWFPKKQELFIDFSVTQKDYGFFGRKTTSYSNINLHPDLPDKTFSSSAPTETVLLNDAMQKSVDEWNAMRHEELSQREKDIYKMVDSVREVPMFNNIVNLVNTLITGYWVHRYIEIGPYYTLYSFNPIEGSRFKLSLRTSNEFSTRHMLYGHIAYGTRDQKFKYGFGFTEMFSTMPRRCANVYYFHDNEQLGLTENAFLTDNILSSLFARKQNDKLTIVNEGGAYYDHEWFPGLSTKLKVRHKQIYASETVTFRMEDLETGDTIDVKSLRTSEVSVNVRFAYNEKFVMGKFERVSLGTKYPIFNVGLTVGIPDILGSKYEYYKLHASIDHTVPVNPLGDFRYIIDAGKTFGKAPFPFQQLHEGNQTYAYDEYAFNLMNYYEFVSSEYLTFMFEHHFKGLFLNHIPLMRRLKWREVATGKVLIGDFTQRTSNDLFFPTDMNLLHRPYAEAGVGIENIFKFFRVDAIWRLSYLDHKDVLPFGILAKMQLRF